MVSFIKVFATGLGTGYFPKIPGTIASLVFGIGFFFLSTVIEILFFISILVFLSFFGVWISGSYEKITDLHDPPEVVIDEIVGMGIAILPCYYGEREILFWCIAFVLFRFFDIVKPPPIFKSQNFAGGWGIMIDDILSGLFSAIILLGIKTFIQ